MPSRNSAFRPEREPFSQRAELELQDQHIGGAVSFLNPTRARFHHTGLASKAGTSETEGEASPSEDGKQAVPVDTPASKVGFLWRSRDNRKGRHTLLIQETKPDEEGKYVTPALTFSLREIRCNVWRTLSYYPYWDISWLVAIFFTLGSVVWVLNSFFVFLPLSNPSSEFPTEILYGGGITAFLGAIVFFETGSILLFFEAVNENESGCFGYEFERLFEGDESSKGGKMRVIPQFKHCIHHHQNRSNFVGKSSSKTAAEVKPSDSDEKSKDGKSWQWFPSWHSLRTHYFHELGFLAATSQLFGATVFGISGFTALPGIQNHLTPQRILNGVYWIPQVIGGTGFIVSGTLYMLESSKNWYTPNFKTLGWHIGFWNWIGAIGFTASGALGMAYGNSGAEFQAAVATFYGSWAFLIGSALQLYESVDKHPVESVKLDDVDPKSLE